MDLQNILQESINVFTQHGWEIKSQMQNSASVEKMKRGMPSWAAVLLMIIFGLIGMLVVIIVKGVAGKEKITLSVRDDGQIQVVGKKTSLYTDNAFDLVSIADLPDGLDLKVIIGIGTFSAIVNGLLFAAIS